MWSLLEWQERGGGADRYKTTVPVIHKQSTPGGHLTHDSPHLSLQSLMCSDDKHDPPSRVEPPLPHLDKTVSPAELWWGSREPMPQTKPREASCVLVVVLQEEEDGRATFQPVGEAAAGGNVECQSSGKRG